jgi:hypothetical protein
MEESPPTTPLKSEYHDVVFHFNPGKAPAEFWAITAWNPDGQDWAKAKICWRTRNLSKSKIIAYLRKPSPPLLSLRRD